ncbi:Oidioi.mRNA.OKI2018_I69.chr2.g6914.t1.cds [Oikopleura dioica]|uniref:Oidioi.mRNA.OKI2018_I69.chr2.g6914.t1.cds n=1 Tax=Oikopleura dioica TaxID=34765 RepID=A0ABN7T4I3_OIKDI|nr:Oidioi.mRNA.OKI2018_I69.chr2.g6914.t1.cds [Oikopleura dioica]
MMKTTLRTVFVLILLVGNAIGRKVGDRRQKCTKLGREYKCSARHQLGSTCFHKTCKSRILRCSRKDNSNRPIWIGYEGNCKGKGFMNNEWSKTTSKKSNEYQNITSWNCLGGSSTPVTDVAQFVFRRKLYIIASSNEAFHLYEIGKTFHPEYIQKVPVNGQSLEKLAMLSVAKKRLMLAAGKNMTTLMYHFPNKEMKRSALTSRSTAKYASDERFGTYRCETRQAKSGRVYFVLDKRIHSRFRKHFSSKNWKEIRSKRDAVDGRCDISSGKNMDVFFAVNNEEPTRGYYSYIDVVEIKDANRASTAQRIPHEYRITATAAFQQGKRASLYVTGDQRGRCTIFRKKFLKT